jgi:hypothetical protein
MRRRKEEERVESTAYVVVFRIQLCQIERLPTNSVAVSSWIWVDLPSLQQGLPVNVR